MIKSILINYKKKNNNKEINSHVEYLRLITLYYVWFEILKIYTYMYYRLFMNALTLFVLKILSVALIFTKFNRNESNAHPRHLNEKNK